MTGPAIPYRFDPQAGVFADYVLYSFDEYRLLDEIAQTIHPGSLYLHLQCPDLPGETRPTLVNVGRGRRGSLPQTPAGRRSAVENIRGLIETIEAAQS